MLDLFEGAKLPALAGIYGFFNLRKNVSPRERILYIGKSQKNLAKRVTKAHHQFVRSLRFGATHVGYVTTSKPESKVGNRTITLTETALIQKWAPYLNRDENPYNFEVEPIDFHA